MAGLSITRQVSAPPERVFAVASDLRAAPTRVTGIRSLEVLDDGPIRVGTRFRETRVMFGREATEEMEIVEFDPPRSYVVGCDSCGCRYRSEFRFEPKDGGTEVTMRFDAQPLTFMAKVMGLLMRPMMKVMAKECGKDLEDIARAAERGDGPGPAGAGAAP